MILRALHARGARRASTAASAYRAEFDRSVADPRAFWADKASRIQWIQPPPVDSLLTSDANGIHRWFAGGKLNASALATEVHARERPQQTALICDSPVTKRISKLNFEQLNEQVGRLAYVLQHEFNIKKGDVVAVYMPMSPEAVITMLACTRIGAVHTVIFGCVLVVQHAAFNFVLLIFWLPILQPSSAGLHHTNSTRASKTRVQSWW